MENIKCGRVFYPILKVILWYNPIYENEIKISLVDVKTRSSRLALAVCFKGAEIEARKNIHHNANGYYSTMVECQILYISYNVFIHFLKLFKVNMYYLYHQQNWKIRQKNI